MVGLVLGAAGVNMGTRFMATQECPIHPNIKQKMIEMQETETALVMKSLKNTSRVFLTPGASKILALEPKGLPWRSWRPISVAGSPKGDGKRALLTKGCIRVGRWSDGSMISRPWPS